MVPDSTRRLRHHGTLVAASKAYALLTQAA